MRLIEKIFQAIKNNNLAELKILLSQTKIQDFYSKEGNMLQVAAKAGHISMVSYLLERGPSSLYGWLSGNPLVEAIKHNHFEVFKLMVNHPKFFKQGLKDKDGNSVLHYVGKMKDPVMRQKMAEVLIKRGMGVSLKNNKGEYPENYDELCKIEKRVANDYTWPFANYIFLKNILNAMGGALIVAGLFFVSPAMQTIALPFGYYFILNIFYKRQDEKVKSEMRASHIKSEINYELRKTTPDENSLIEYLRSQKNKFLIVDTFTLSLMMQQKCTKLVKYLLSQGIVDANYFLLLAIVMKKPAFAKLALSCGADPYKNKYAAKAMLNLQAEKKSLFSFLLSSIEWVRALLLGAKQSSVLDWMSLVEARKLKHYPEFAEIRKMILSPDEDPPAKSQQQDQPSKVATFRVQMHQQQHKDTAKSSAVSAKESPKKRASIR